MEEILMAWLQPGRNYENVDHFEWEWIFGYALNYAKIDTKWAKFCEMF